MKFELKTEDEIYSKSILDVLKTLLNVLLIIIICDVALKLGNISRHYQIKDNCRLLAVEKSSSNFEKLSSLSKLKSKQKIWEFCKEVVK